MAHENRRTALLKKHGLKGVNKPKRTPGHKTKSHMVLAAEGHDMKLIRFGQQGVSGAGKNPTTARIRHVRRVIMLDMMLKESRPVSYQLNIGRIKSNGKEINRWHYF